MKIMIHLKLGIAFSLLCGAALVNSAVARDDLKTEGQAKANDNPENTPDTNHAKHKDEIALQSWSWKTKAGCEANLGKRNATCVPSPKGKKFGWDIKMTETIELSADKSTATPTATPTDFRGWVTRVSYSRCPGGTTEYVATDGGAACWAGPI
jgi:hypothetical protein